MATMNISLPDSLKDWVEARTRASDYSNASDYIRDLIRKDKAASSQRSWFEAEIEKGYASGFSETTVAQLSADLKREAEGES